MEAYTEEERKHNAAAHSLLSSHGHLLRGVIAGLMQSQLEVFTGSQPGEAEQREHAYHKVQALQELQMTLTNMADAHQRALQTSNPA